MSMEAVMKPIILSTLDGFDLAAHRFAPAGVNLYLRNFPPQAHG